MKLLSRLKNCIFIHKVYDIYDNSVSEMRMSYHRTDVDIQQVNNISELKRLIKARYDFTKSPMLIEDCFLRLHTGAIMFCAFVDRKIAHVSWFGKESSEFFEFPVGPDEVCIGCTETVQEYRRMGISSAVHAKMFDYTRNLGRTHALLAVQKTNTPSVNSQNKLGSVVVGIGIMITIFHIFTFRWIKHFKFDERGRYRKVI